MTEWLTHTAFIEWLSQTELGKMFAVFLLSMVPVVELRGGIPLGTAWGLPWYLAFIAAFIGNMLPIPFILLFLEKILVWMKPLPVLGKFVSWLEKKADKNSEKIEKYGKWGLFVLVAIPLPGTGAWTGALVASFLKMKMKDSLPVIALGVIGAGFLMTFGSQLVKFLLPS